ncbi:hypothetical protein FGQ54_17460 [Acinetobacter lwoffii]|nr:hypothetical protein FGQ54_17460 [Acinetobacter lwoffii]
MKKMNIGILLFDEVEVLDFAGPYEVFAITTDSHNKKLFEPYRVCRRVNILRDYPDDKIKIYP